MTIERGEVWFRASGDSVPRQITRSGRDRDARLSPDGRTIAFIRGTPGDSVDAGSGREEAGSLWIIPSAGGVARMLVRGRDDPAPERILAGLQSPQFSPDGRTLYFLSAAWATSAAVHAVDVATGAERFVAPGNSLEVVPRGRYAGSLLVWQHRYFLVAGTYDWVWLITPDGKDVGPVGETEEAVAEFREMYVTP
ncbi:MAG TPA: hypothetical protein VFJ16_29910 [Longimicrobium sp.]|nr:hypothetical protein [Longimicrobium sp.]